MAIAATARELTKQYAEMGSKQLEELAANQGSLTNEARRILLDEIERREREEAAFRARFAKGSSPVGPVVRASMGFWKVVFAVFVGNLLTAL
ncbi:MAG: hypothetical protein WBF42_18470, partial [Terracidiphilus sp.]